MYRSLASIESSVQGESAATKRAWPLVFDGLPAHVPASTRAVVATAAVRARALAASLPPLFQEHGSDELTGPASGVAGEVHSFAILAARGWQLIGAAIEQIQHRSAFAARFARANVGLYIESVYDAHFTLAQVGKQMRKGWEKLEGAPAFGSTLTLAEIEALAAVYSEPNFQLQPHAGVKLGS